MRRTLAALVLTPRRGAGAEAVSVFWLTQQTTFSQETEGGPTYSLNFRSGGVGVGGESLKPGCWAGPVKAGTLMTFRGAREVELHLPARPCPRS